MTLILTICTALACWAEAIPAPGPAAPVGCMITAQATIAEWMQMHPTKTVTAWRCEVER